MGRARTSSQANNCVIQAPSLITGSWGKLLLMLTQHLAALSSSAAGLGRLGAMEQPEAHLSALKEQRVRSRDEAGARVQGTFWSLWPLRPLASSQTSEVSTHSCMRLGLGQPPGCFLWEPWTLSIL